MKDVEEYKRRYDSYLQQSANQLQSVIQEYLSGVENIDRIAARAKDPNRFAEKATRTEEGKQKYRAPLTEIQDQIGARVIVFYQEDVPKIWNVLSKYFRHIEEKDLVPESEWSFGYFGRHFVVATPPDIFPKDVKTTEAPRFFELQIKTLFQHAWSEANHDLGYKAKKPLNPDQLRRLAYTSAQAWGADRIFSELNIEIKRAAGA